MRKVILLLYLCPFLFISCDVLQAVLEENGQLSNGISSFSTRNLLKAKPPITTNFSDDVVTEVISLDDFNPTKEQFQDANLLDRTENGSYILKEGLFYLETNSYCIKAGTYGPSKGDGYVYAPLKGPKANIIRKLVENSYDNDKVTQQEVQQLIWAVIANTKYSNMAERHQKTAIKLLSLVEIQQLDGGLWALVPNDIKNKAIQSVAPALQKIYQTEDKMRGLLSNANTTYNQLENLAVLSGVPSWGEEIRPTPSGRWAYNPDGFFIRMFPRGYQNTRVELYIPSYTQVTLNNNNKIASISVDKQIELTFEYANLNQSIPNKVSVFSLKKEFMQPEIPISNEGFLSLSSNDPSLPSELLKFNAQIPPDQSLKWSELEKLKNLITGSTIEKQYKQVIGQGIKEAQLHFFYEAIQTNNAPQKTKVLSEKINQISNINQLNFDNKKVIKDYSAVYNPIENVSVPAYTSKQRIAVSPKKPYNAPEENCTKTTFDQGKKRYAKSIYGMQIRGSIDFIALVEKALNVVKTDSPTQFHQLLSPKRKLANFPFRGVGIACHGDAHTIDAYLYARLTIPNQNKYDWYQETPELLGSIILHEATHIHQYYQFMKLTGYRTFEDFLKYFGKDKITQGKFEVAASKRQLTYLNIAIKKYPKGSRDYNNLKLMIDHVENYKNEHSH